MVAKVVNLFSLIVGVAFATVIVTGKNTAAVITAFGKAFSMSLGAAMSGA